MLSDNKIERFIKLAEKHQLRSDFRQKLVAIIFNKNRVISIGVNTSTKSYPWLKKYFLHGTLHAEIASLVSILHRDNNSNFNMFVFRKSLHNNLLRNAKPCPMCVQTLYNTGWFKNIFWTTDDETIACDKIENLYIDVMKIDKDLRYLLNGKIIKA